MVEAHSLQVSAFVVLVLTAGLELVVLLHCCHSAEVVVFLAGSDEVVELHGCQSRGTAAQVDGSAFFEVVEAQSDQTDVEVLTAGLLELEADQSAQLELEAVGFT